MSLTEDTYNCGVCKNVFTDLLLFLEHKKKLCGSGAQEEIRSQFQEDEVPQSQQLLIIQNEENKEEFIQVEARNLVVEDPGGPTLVQVIAEEEEKDNDEAQEPIEEGLDEEFMELDFDISKLLICQKSSVQLYNFCICIYHSFPQIL